MALITTADLENAKLDVTDLGEFVNNDQVVTTRTGASYDSVRKIVRQSNEAISEAIADMESEVDYATATLTNTVNEALEDLETQVETTISEQTAIVTDTAESLETIINQAINTYAWYNNRGGMASNNSV